MHFLRLNVFCICLFSFCAIAADQSTPPTALSAIQQQIESALTTPDLSENRRDALNELLQQIDFMKEEWESVPIMDFDQGTTLIRSIESDITRLQLEKAPQDEIDKLYRKAFIIWNKSLYRPHLSRRQQKNERAGGRAEGCLNLGKDVIVATGAGGSLAMAIGCAAWALVQNDYALAKAAVPPLLLGIPLWVYMGKSIWRAQLNTSSRRKFMAAAHNLLSQNDHTVGLCEMKALAEKTP